MPISLPIYSAQKLNKLYGTDEPLSLIHLHFC